MLYARQTKDTDETFEARCPHCSHWNIFSRASDLGDFSAIAFRKVRCQSDECNAEFAINGDTIDPRFAKALFTVFELPPQKQFGQSVASICRAYELFFIRVVYKEAYRPTEQEAHALFDEARDILWTLADDLDVRYESV